MHDTNLMTSHQNLYRLVLSSARHLTLKSLPLIVCSHSLHNHCSIEHEIGEKKLDNCNGLPIASEDERWREEWNDDDWSLSKRIPESSIKLHGTVYI